MKEIRFAGRWATRLILVGVLGALFTLGIFQYRWMSQSARGEEEQQSRFLMLTVTRTIFGEFERLAAELRPAEGFSRGKDLKTAVAEGFHSSPFSENPDPIITAGGIILEGGRTYLRYNREGWSPETAVPPELLRMLRRWQNREAAHSAEVLFLIRPPSSQNSSYILRSSTDSPERALFLEIEFFNFLENYLLPALEGGAPRLRRLLPGGPLELPGEITGFFQKTGKDKGEGLLPLGGPLFPGGKGGALRDCLRKRSDDG